MCVCLYLCIENSVGSVASRSEFENEATALLTSLENVWLNVRSGYLKIGEKNYTFRWMNSDKLDKWKSIVYFIRIMHVI